MLGTPLSLIDATIEDIVPRATYAAAVKKALGHTFTLDAKENTAPTNVSCLEMLFKRNWGDFGMNEKAAVALTLIEEWAKDCANVPADTLEAARKVFREINQHLNATGT